MDAVAYLIKITTNGKDEEGNLQKLEQEQQIFCKVRSVTRSEFYSAATQDLEPELQLIISHRIDYDGQKLVDVCGQRYRVIRTYWQGDEVSLTLARYFSEEEEEA